MAICGYLVYGIDPGGYSAEGKRDDRSSRTYYMVDAKGLAAAWERDGFSTTVFELVPIKL